MIFGIMGAMPDEVDQLCAKLENVTVEPYGGVDYHKGTLAGRQVVVCCAGMGKANAAATTQVLITKFGAEKIIFSGIAGNMTSKIGIGDVVIGKTVLPLESPTGAFIAAQPRAFRSYFFTGRGETGSDIFAENQTLNRNSITSPSLTTYSLPSVRCRPLALTAA